MDPESQHGLRQGLRELAEQPVPPGLADRALVGATSLRRRRRTLTAVAALGTIGLIGAAGAAAIPLLASTSGPPAASSTAPQVTSPSTPLVCGTATDEPVPPDGARDELPAVAQVVLELLPPRDDYHIGWVFSACERDGQWVFPDGSAVEPGDALARVQLSIGENNSGGRVKVDLYRSFPPGVVLPSCAAIPTLAPEEELLFCEDRDGEAPMLIGLISRGENVVMAVFADGRGAMMENDAPSIGIDVMRAVVTDPTLLALVA